jgi:DNA-binding transcriptional ArsR family regulator
MIIFDDVDMDANEEEIKSLEEEVFKALDHQKRRDILRYVGEKKGGTFTKIMNSTGIQDSPTLSYHLRALSPFMKQKEGRYIFTPIGKAAYSLLLKTADYKTVALLHRKKTGAIIGNIFLWISAIAAALVMSIDSFYSAIILPSFAGVSLMVINELFE